MVNLPNRELLVLTRQAFLSDQDIQEEARQLDEILQTIENRDHFCNAHELVDRNRITRKPWKILDAIKEEELRVFRFLINKN